MINKVYKSGAVKFDHVRILGGLRWMMSIGFFFLAISKGLLLVNYGLKPYRVIVDAVGLPSLVSFYGVVAVLVEVYFAVGVWYDKTFKAAVGLAGLMTLTGIAISIALIAFKVNSDCGCGLVGDNEYGLLIQKLIIIAGLVILYKNESVLFAEQIMSNADKNS